MDKFENLLRISKSFSLYKSNYDARENEDDAYDKIRQKEVDALPSVGRHVWDTNKSPTKCVHCGKKYQVLDQKCDKHK